MTRAKSRHGSNGDHGRAGFTLIEMVISISIFMIFTTIVASSFTTLMRANRTANETQKIYLVLFHAVLMFLAFLSKETAVLFPVIIIAYLIFNRFSLFKKAYIPLYLSWVFIYAFWYFLRAGAIQDLPDKQIFGLIPFIENLRSLPEYISKFIVPYNLMPLPVYQTAITAIGGIIIIFTIIFFFYKKNFNRQTFIFGIFWFIILILPAGWFWIWERRLLAHNWNVLLSKLVTSQNLLK